MNEVQILSIYYGSTIPLTDPEQQLKDITAITVPFGLHGNKVCFVKYRGIVDLGHEQILMLDVLSGRRQMSMCQIVCNKGKWINTVNRGAVYILPDVTRRMLDFINK